MKQFTLICILTALTVLFFKATLNAGVFTGPIQGRKIDKDGDGKIDALAIDVEVDVPAQDNRYLIRGFLMSKEDLDSKRPDYPALAYSQYSLDLKQGRCFIPMYFDGYDIFRNKMSGPFMLGELYFGRYLASTPKDIYEDLDYRKTVDVPVASKYTEFEQPDLSFKGKEAIFDLSLGQTARIVEGNIGSKDIKLLSVTANSVAVSVSSGPDNDWRKEIAVGEDTAFQMGGLEQMGVLQLLEVKDDAAKFKIRFGSALPAPEIPDDMPIEIIYSE